MKTIKLLFLGDGSIGKTCLIHRYIYGNFPTDYVPSQFEGYKGKIKINNSIYFVTPWDCTSYAPEGIRLLCYPRTDIVMLCFSIVNKLSFENIRTIWYPEIKANLQDPEILLIGTKSDLKKTIPPDQCVRKDEAIKMAKEINAFDYVECSSLLGSGVNRTFELAYIHYVKHSRILFRNK